MWRITKDDTQHSTITQVGRRACPACHGEQRMCVLWQLGSPGASACGAPIPCISSLTSADAYATKFHVTLTKRPPSPSPSRLSSGRHHGIVTTLATPAWTGVAILSTPLAEAHLVRKHLMSEMSAHPYNHSGMPKCNKEQAVTLQRAMALLRALRQFFRLTFWLLHVRQH